MQADPASRRPIPARKFAATRWFIGWLDRRGLSPDQVSVFGLAAGVLSGVLLALTSVVPAHASLYWLGSAGLVLFRGLSNMADGMLAIEQGKAKPDGLFYNEVPDRLSDIALFVGAGYSLGGSPTAGWLVACLALLVTYIRALGVLAGAPADFGGPFAKQQRMYSVAFLCLLLAVTPTAWHFSLRDSGPMALWLWIMAAGTAWTGVLRLRRAIAYVNRPTSSE